MGLHDYSERPNPAFLSQESRDSFVAFIVNADGARRHVGAHGRFPIRARLPGQIGARKIRSQYGLTDDHDLAISAFVECAGKIVVHQRTGNHVTEQGAAGFGRHLGHVVSTTAGLDDPNVEICRNGREFGSVGPRNNTAGGVQHNEQLRNGILLLVIGQEIADGSSIGAQ